MFRLVSLAGVVLLNGLPSLLACEGCKEPSNVAGQSGVGGISASFSWSVVFMLGVIAFLLTGLVVMMVRSCKQLAAQHNPSAAYVTSRSADYSIVRVLLRAWRALEFRISNFGMRIGRFATSNPQSAFQIRNPNSAIRDS
ncbi:MAG TPA: hypothetical protein VE860_11475 [Chthoniobacterales bacterium]|jgi:hypothetical protein|nr:hypothetical protein [Chthoniobacterales bacterium]